MISRMRPLRARPLTLVAAGLVLVVFDFRTRALDLLPDPAGWLLLAGAAVMLGVRLAGLLAGAAAVLSVADVLLDYRYVPIETPVAIDSDAVEVTYHQRWDVLGDGRAALTSVALVVGGAALCLVLQVLRARARDAGAGDAARLLGLAPWAAVVGWIAPHGVVVGVALGRDEPYDPVWNEPLSYVGLLAIVVVGAMVVLLAMEREASWALPPGAERPSPWASRRQQG